MAKVLAIGDPHFKYRGATRYARMSEEIIDRANQVKPDAIVILGDTLHTHEMSHVVPFNMAYKMINSLRKIALTIVIIGNHDYKSNVEYLSDNHFFNPLKEWDNVVVIDTVKEISIGKYIFGFCPYVYPGLFIKALYTQFNSNALTKCRCIFAHQEIRGCQMGAIKSENGDIWKEDYPLLITGHIHEFQILQKNVIYVGTPIQHNFGDGTDKGIYLFEFEDTNYSMKKLHLTVPLKRIYRVDTEEIRTLTIPENVEAKIIVMSTPEQYSAIEKEGLIQYFRDRGCVVIHGDITLSSVMPEIDIGRHFLDILYDKIKYDAHLIETYKGIFGSKRRILVTRKG